MGGGEQGIEEAFGFSGVTSSCDSASTGVGNQTQILCKSSTVTTELPLHPFPSHQLKFLTKAPIYCAAFGMGLIPLPQWKSLLPQFLCLPHCALMGVNRIGHFRIFYQFRTYVYLTFCLLCYRGQEVVCARLGGGRGQ